MNDVETVTEELIVPLRSEEAVVSVRKTASGTVRVQVRTVEREHLVETELAHERCEVERVPIGRDVDSVPPVREEDGVTIVPVVEEVVVVTRRLVLKEEVRIRRVRSSEPHRETVILREQEAVVERLAGGVPAKGLEPDPTHTPT